MQLFRWKGSSTYRSIRALDRLAWIHRCTGLTRSHVRVSTRCVFARETRKARQVIVKAVQPHGTIVRSQRPLSHNHGSKLTFHGSNGTLLVTGVRIKANPRIGVSPGLVNVCVERTFGASVHESTPRVRIKAKGVMHNVLPIRCFSLYDQVSFPVKALEYINGGKLPRFIERLNTKDSWVAFVRFDDCFNHIQGVLNVVVLDVGVRGRLRVKVTDPPCCTNWPANEKTKESSR